MLTRCGSRSGRSDRALTRRQARHLRAHGRGERRQLLGEVRQRASPVPLSPLAPRSTQGLTGSPADRVRRRAESRPHVVRAHQPVDPVAQAQKGRRRQGKGLGGRHGQRVLLVRASPLSLLSPWRSDADRSRLCSCDSCHADHPSRLVRHSLDDCRQLHPPVAPPLFPRRLSPFVTGLATLRFLRPVVHLVDMLQPCKADCFALAHESHQVASAALPRDLSRGTSVLHRSRSAWMSGQSCTRSWSDVHCLRVGAEVAIL